MMVEWDTKLSGTTSAKTRLLGVIGWPVSHSLSPKIHSLAIARLGLDAVYLAFPVHPTKLEAAILGLDAAGVLGLNVTSPHKQEVLPLLQGATELAAGLGAVNTIFRDEDGALFGDNTDVGGLFEAIGESRAGIEGAPAAVVGAGGAAAAAVVALAQRGAGKVTILGRSMDRAEGLAARITASGLCRDATIAAAPLADHKTILESAAVLVQASSAPVDQGPAVDLGLCRRNTLVVEMAYDAKKPGSTAFLAAAREAGLATIAGEEILIRQAALAWERWTGRSVAADCRQAMTEISRTYRGISGPP